MYVCVPYVCLVSAETRRYQISGTRVRDICEPPYGCWKSNPSPLEEKLVLLTAEPALQPHGVYFLILVL